MQRPPIGWCRLHLERWIHANQPVIEDSGVVEDVHRLRITALLHGPVREKGNRVKAAGAGHRPQDVASCMRTARLSWGVSEALLRGCYIRATT